MTKAESRTHYFLLLLLFFIPLISAADDSVIFPNHKSYVTDHALTLMFFDHEVNHHNLFRSGPLSRIVRLHSLPNTDKKILSTVYVSQEIMNLDIAERKEEVQKMVELLFSEYQSRVMTMSRKEYARFQREGSHQGPTADMKPQNISIYVHIWTPERSRIAGWTNGSFHYSFD